MSIYQTFTDVLLVQDPALDWKLSTKQAKPKASVGSYYVCICSTSCNLALPCLIMTQF